MKKIYIKGRVDVKKKMLQLSKRLQAIADLVSKGSRIADIGCDHAYISIYLIQSQIAIHSIAMDVRQGPLQRAKENILHYGLEDKIETRLSNGTKMLENGEADTIILAGMGGSLMVRILSDRPELISEVSELILQPQSEIAKVRRYVKEVGFEILKEMMVLEDHKYYMMFQAKNRKGLEKEELFEKEISEKKEIYEEYGELLLKERNPVLKEYLLSEQNLYEEICKELQGIAVPKTAMRLKEIEEKLIYIEEALKYYGHQ